MFIIEIVCWNYFQVFSERKHPITISETSTKNIIKNGQQNRNNFSNIEEIRTSSSQVQDN